jgi:hypothetical protein
MSDYNSLLFLEQYANSREQNAVNRLFENSFGIGRNNPIALMTSEKSAYRVTRDSQIQDIIESGFAKTAVWKNRKADIVMKFIGAKVMINYAILIKVRL